MAIGAISESASKKVDGCGKICCADTATSGFALTSFAVVTIKLIKLNVCAVMMMMTHQCLLFRFSLH